MWRCCVLQGQTQPGTTTNTLSKPAGCQNIMRMWRDLWTHKLDCRRPEAPSGFIHGAHLFVPVLPAQWTLNWSAPNVSNLSLSCLFTAVQTTLLYPEEQASKVCNRSWSEVHRRKFCSLYFVIYTFKKSFSSLLPEVQGWIPHAWTKIWDMLWCQFSTTVLNGKKYLKIFQKVLTWEFFSE